MKRILLIALVIVMLVPGMVRAETQDQIWLESGMLAVSQENTISWLSYLFDKDNCINIYLCMKSAGYGQASAKVEIARNLRNVTSYKFDLEYYDLKILARERDIADCKYYFLLESPTKLIYASNEYEVFQSDFDVKIYSPGGTRHIVLSWFSQGFDIVWNKGEYPSDYRVGISLERDNKYMHIANTNNTGIYKYIPDANKIAETFGENFEFDDFVVKIWIYEMKPGARGYVYEISQEQKISLRKTNIINVISPNGGESIKLNEAFPIQWEATATPFTPDNEIEILLMSGAIKDGVYESVFLTTELNDGSCYVRITQNQLDQFKNKENNYKIMIINKSITTSDDQFIGDWSDAVFEIQ